MTDATIPSSVPEYRPSAGPPRDVLTAGMLEALKGTKPWVRFVSILGFLVAILMVLAALGMGGFGVYRITAGGPEGYMLAGMAVLYLVFAILYIYPSRFLFRYASAIGEALAAPSKSAAVERALVQQKSFWKFVGIMILVMMLMYIPLMFLMFSIPGLMAAFQN